MLPLADMFLLRFKLYVINVSLKFNREWKSRETLLFERNPQSYKESLTSWSSERLETRTGKVIIEGTAVVNNV